MAKNQEKGHQRHFRYQMVDGSFIPKEELSVTVESKSIPYQSGLKNL